MLYFINHPLHLRSIFLFKYMVQFSKTQGFNGSLLVRWPFNGASNLFNFNDAHRCNIIR
ncbi:MAG: hypothetical protein RLZZ68_842 [Bacteroidota bacterium]|jgi:hypothetical protein